MKNTNLLSELRNFIGSENYFINSHRFVYTDGVKYLAQTARCYWLLDDISFFQDKKEIKQNYDLQKIQFWKLIVNPDESASLICERDEGEIIFKTSYVYTSFPVSELRIYLCEMWKYWEYKGQSRGNNPAYYGVLLLPSEY